MNISHKKRRKKEDFDNESVLERFKIQLNNSGIKTKYSLRPDFSWASIKVDKIVNKFYKSYQDEIAMNPEGHAMDYIHIIMDIEKI